MFPPTVLQEAWVLYFCSTWNSPKHFPPCVHVDAIECVCSPLCFESVPGIWLATGNMQKLLEDILLERFQLSVSRQQPWRDDHRWSWKVIFNIPFDELSNNRKQRITVLIHFYSAGHGMIAKYWGSLQEAGGQASGYTISVVTCWGRRGHSDAINRKG